MVEQENAKDMEALQEKKRQARRETKLETTTRRKLCQSKLTTSINMVETSRGSKMVWNLKYSFDPLEIY